MTIIRDENAAVEALAIVEKYEAFVDYLYPLMQRAPRRHGVARDAVLAAMFAPVEDMYAAAKSRQASRLYLLDARTGHAGWADSHHLLRHFGLEGEA